MDQKTRVLSGEARFGGAVLITLGIFVGMAGLFAAARQELEPLSSAEARCQDAAPAKVVDAEGWAGCVERESAKSGIEAALPTLGLACGSFLIGCWMRVRHPAVSPRG